MVNRLRALLEGPGPELAAPVGTLVDIAEATSTRTFAAAENGRVFYMRLKGLSQDMSCNRYEMEGQTTFVGAPINYAFAAMYRYDNSAPDHYFRLVDGSQSKPFVWSGIAMDCVRADAGSEFKLLRGAAYALAFVTLMTGADTLAVRSGNPTIGAASTITQRSTWPYYSSGFTVAGGWPQTVKIRPGGPYTGAFSVAVPNRELAVPTINVDAFKFPHIVVPPVYSVIPFL
jgi:hypothetical protein